MAMGETVICLDVVVVSYLALRLSHVKGHTFYSCMFSFSNSIAPIVYVGETLKSRYFVENTRTKGSRHRGSDWLPHHGGSQGCSREQDTRLPQDGHQQPRPHYGHHPVLQHLHQVGRDAVADTSSRVSVARCYKGFLRNIYGCLYDVGGFYRYTVISTPRFSSSFWNRISVFILDSVCKKQIELQKG